VGDPIVGTNFPGPFNAPPHQLEQQALDERAALGNQVRGVHNPVLEEGLRSARGDYLYAGSNPYLQSAINAATRPIDQSLFEKYLPALGSEAIQQGAYKGSSRRGLAEASLMRDAFQAKGDIASQMALQNLGRERGLQFQAPNMIDEAIRLGQLSPELSSQAGAGYRGLAQAGIEERMRQFEESIQAPFRPLLPLASIIRGTDLGTNQVTSRPSNSFQSGILGALGGGAGGAAAGYGLASGPGGFSGGQGAAIGGGLGALAGGLAGAFG
jgi:hypothetical protein